MSYVGYRFLIGSMELPYAPSELKIDIGSNNQTVQLIDGREINILKDPKLRTIEFEAELPRVRQYPFANKMIEAKQYIDYFNSLLANKTPVKLMIIRTLPTYHNGILGTKKQKFTENDTLVTDLLVSLEDYGWKESAQNAFDLTVSLKFKEYISFGTTKTVIVNNQSNGATTPTTVTVDTPEKTVTENENHTVKSGDNLWKIAREHYGTANNTLVNKIYEVNKTVIEDAAKKHGKKSSYKGSTPGWWIYPGTKLIIPKS